MEFRFTMPGLTVASNYTYMNFVTATARNLFNRDYAESIGFPAPPANFLAGLRYGF